MFDKIIKYILIISSLFYLTGCVGEPKVPDSKFKKISKDSGTIWVEKTNIDENQTINISDLNKNIIDNKTVVTEDIVDRIEFPVEEYENLEKVGKGTINGYIYLEDKYGNKIYGKNSKLFLNPITSYSKQWYIESYKNGKKMSKADARLFNYVKFTSSNDYGRFVFYGVPSGGYYITGSVICGVDCGYDTPKKIRIAKEIYVNDKEIINQDINKRF